jgi:hypothetical protein
LRRNAKAICTHSTIKIIIQHRQEYQHQYFREEKPNSLVNAAGKLRVRITIIEDVAVRTNIARITLLTATRRNNSKLIWRSKSLKTVPKKLLSYSTTINAGKKISSSNKELKVTYYETMTSPLT